MQKKIIKKRKVKNRYINNQYIIYLAPFFLFFNLCGYVESTFFSFFFLFYNFLLHSINEYKYSINLLSEKQRCYFKQSKILLEKQ